MNLPPTWNRMSFTAKAGYLAATCQARDYSHACSILAKMRGPKRRVVAPTVRQIRLPYAD